MSTVKDYGKAQQMYVDEMTYTKWCNCGFYTWQKPEYSEVIHRVLFEAFHRGLTHEEVEEVFKDLRGWGNDEFKAVKAIIKDTYLNSYYLAYLVCNAEGLDDWQEEGTLDIIINIVIDAMGRKIDIDNIVDALYELSFLEVSQVEEIEIIQGLIDGWYAAYNIVLYERFSRLQGIDELLEYLYQGRNTHGKLIPIEYTCKFWYEFLNGYLSTDEIKSITKQLCIDNDLYYCEDNGYIYIIDYK